MANLPNDPLAPPSAPSGSNKDLPAADFPGLNRIASTDLVGPEAANRQHAALEKRTVYLRQYLIQITAMLNALDTTFLRRDGSAPKDGNAGVRADLSFNNNRILDLADGEVSAASTHAINGRQLFQSIAAFVPPDGAAGFSIIRDPTTGLLKLVGDIPVLPPNAYYGTDGAGNRGWQPWPTASAPVAPNKKQLHFPTGLTLWTVPDGVTTVWAAIAGAQGGSGEPGNGGAAAGIGGLGGVVYVRLTVSPGEVLELLVGGKGGNGYGGTWGGAGGGGGGGSRVRSSTRPAEVKATAGGGGGGGGGGESGDSQGGFVGGAGGQTGGSGYGGSVGGAAGSGGITEAGGPGGAGGGGYGGAGANGAVGGSVVAAGISTEEDWVFRDSDLDVSDGNGDISLRWYQP